MEENQNKENKKYRIWNKECKSAASYFHVFNLKTPDQVNLWNDNLN